MGRNYSFDLWIEREQLFDALAVVARYEQSGALASLIWPDGRRLPVENLSQSDDEELLPIDFPLRTGFCLSFLFEEDEALRRWNEADLKDAKNMIGPNTIL